MFTVNLNDVTRQNKKVGGKGANLGEMVQAGLPIPPGFVLTTDSYKKFIEKNNLNDRINKIIHNVNPEEPRSLENASQEIATLILNGKISEDIKKAVKDSYDELSVGKEIKEIGGKAMDMVKTGRDCFVAVRSSATAEDLAEASFAGQMSTFLNVRGLSSLLNAIKKCWASLYTPRAIFYRHNKNITETPLIGVIIQKMVNAEKAGVVFTVEPSTNDPDKVVVEAAWGLGESVVSGRVTPDVYTVDKNTREIRKKISKKKTYRTRNKATGKTVEKKVPEEKTEAQVLSDDEIMKLFELSIQDERHYGKPQDIEWCSERGKLYLVQTRPVTTLGKKAETPKEEVSGDVVLKGMGASPGLAKGTAKVVHERSDLSKIQKGDVLVATMTNPDFVQYMRKASAIITNEGGHTSHAAIVSRELGIPCIVGTDNATEVLQDNQEITVDATSGKVYSGAGGPVSRPGAEQAAPSPAEGAPVGETATEIKVNIAFPETAEKVADKAEGVGLLRAEHMLTESGKHPVYLARENPEELVRIITEGVGKIAKAFYPKPVWYRTLDARTDEFRSLEGGENEPEEANPMLGWHGIRRALDDTGVFRCELEAIRQLHQEGLNNIAVMLPFVSKVEEFRRAKEMVDFPLRFGIMVETPASVMEIESFCKAGIDFVSIGSNDLTQLVLGVDRGNTKIARIYSELDPAVIKMIDRTIKTCKKYDVPTSICGEAGSNPKMAKKLVEFGIDSISCEMDAIDNIRSLVARTEKRLLLEQIRNR